MAAVTVPCARCPRSVDLADTWFYPATGDYVCAACHQGAHVRHLALTTSPTRGDLR